MASGTGTILESLIGAGIPLALVMVDRHCRAEEVAQAAGIECYPLIRADFSPSFDREGYSKLLAEKLGEYGIELVVMAGFGTILGASAHDAFPGRILNTHPALLPAFKGWHAVRDALDAGVKVTGCTVHVATLEVDEGLILAQEAVPVLEGDDESSLHERIKAVERRLYPQTVLHVVERLQNGEPLA